MMALYPKEYYQTFEHHSSNKKQKGLKKLTAGMDFNSYSRRLSDLNEFSKEYVKKPKEIQQKRFQIINDSMQMKGVSKAQFAKLNDKIFYFSNGIISVPYGHPSLENMRKEKHKNRLMHEKYKKQNMNT